MHICCAYHFKNCTEEIKWFSLCLCRKGKIGQYQTITKDDRGQSACLILWMWSSLYAVFEEKIQSFFLILKVWSLLYPYIFQDLYRISCILIDIRLNEYFAYPVRPQIAKFMGPIWGPPGSCRPQMGPMWIPWTLLSGTLLGFRIEYCEHWQTIWKSLTWTT